MPTVYRGTPPLHAQRPNLLSKKSRSTLSYRNNQGSHPRLGYNNSWLQQTLGSSVSKTQVTGRYKV